MGVDVVVSFYCCCCCCCRRCLFTNYPTEESLGQVCMYSTVREARLYPGLLLIDYINLFILLCILVALQRKSRRLYARIKTGAHHVSGSTVIDINLVLYPATVLYCTYEYHHITSDA